MGATEPLIRSNHITLDHRQMLCVSFSTTNIIDGKQEEKKRDQDLAIPNVVQQIMEICHPAVARSQESTLPNKSVAIFGRSDL